MSQSEASISMNIIYGMVQAVYVNDRHIVNWMKWIKTKMKHYLYKYSDKWYYSHDSDPRKNFTMIKFQELWNIDIKCIWLKWMYTFLLKEKNNW